MFLYAFYRKHLWLLRILFVFLMGLFVAIGVALYKINLETLRGNIISALQDATNMPVEIDGKISWRFSLRPEIEFNSLRIPNAQWANQKNLFSADKIDVRLDLLSLFKSKPVIRNIQIHNAKIALEKNDKGESSVVFIERQTPENQPYTSNETVEIYPVKPLPFGGIDIQNINANIYGKQYDLVSFGMRNFLHDNKLEYSGWVKPYDTNLPFVVKFSEYNPERKIYPVRIAFATGADALIADVALEQNSKIPIDFIIQGEIPNIKKSGHWFNVNIMDLPKMRVDIAGGVDRKKISFKKFFVSMDQSEINISGTYDWSKKQPVIKAKISSNNIDLYKSFPQWYGVGQEWVHPNRELNVFKDMPLFGQYLYDMNADIELNLKKFVVYRSLALFDLKAKINVKNHKIRVDADTDFANGNVNAVIVADIDKNGVYTAESAAVGEHVYVGDILQQVRVNNIISGLPVNLSFYIRATGKDMSQIMQTFTGPLVVYSVDKGYAHADLVEYMYGGDFLTSLRHDVEDLFTNNKRDMIEINGAVVNVILRNGLIETQNGVAVETKVINLRLAGTLDLGKEEIQLSLATVPVRGLKLSLSGNLVNSLQISGNLAEPDFKISGAAVAGKVGSAFGLGLLLAPLTGGLSIAGGIVAGLLAGDLIENWLADDKPYKTALKTGAPLKPDDPEWLHNPIEVLSQPLFEAKGK